MDSRTIARRTASAVADCVSRIVLASDENTTTPRKKDVSSYTPHSVSDSSGDSPVTPKTKDYARDSSTKSEANIRTS